jgi:hypothetical protein
MRAALLAIAVALLIAGGIEASAFNGLDLLGWVALVLALVAPTRRRRTS